MPHSLTINPPQLSSLSNELEKSQQESFQSYRSDSPGEESPTAPEYSPITPKVQPALPVIAPSAATTSFVPPDHGGTFDFSMSEQKHQTQPPHHPAQSIPFTPVGDHSQQERQPNINSNQLETKAVPPTYIPQPPNQPFSSDDASDAIALRAAISTLQFQRRKAQDDLKALARIKALALEDPQRFKIELASGNLKEQRMTMGDLQAILDQSDSEDEDDDMEAKREGEYTTNKSRATSAEAQAEIPDSQPSDGSKSSNRASQPYPPIPGPQNVVRMPYVNWDKYGIVGESLDAMHAQQQRWPGNTGSDRGREYTPAAPYSPFLDDLEGHAKNDGDTGPRKDSAAAAATVSAMTPTGTISEHPMETRSRT